MEFPSQRFKDDAERSTGLMFIRTYNQWHTAISKALKKIGLTHPQFVVLTSLNFLSQQEGHITQVTLAKMADMDVMTLSQIVKGLEKKGYLLREQHPQDSRANALVLLPEGQAVVTVALPIVVDIDDQFFGVLSDEEPEFRRYLKTLIQGEIK